MTIGDAQVAVNPRWAAIIAAFAIAALPLYLIGPRAIGMALGVQDPTSLGLSEQVAAIVAHPTVYASLGLLSLVVGPSLIVLALALHEFLRMEAPFAMRVATTAGVISGALFLLAGFGPMATSRFLTELAEQDRSAAIALYVTNQSVTDRQITTSMILFGAFALTTSIVAARRGLVSRALSWIGAVTAIAVVAPFVVPELWFVSLLMMVVWSAWLGVNLSRSHRKRTTPQTEAPLGRA